MICTKQNSLRTHTYEQNLTDLIHSWLQMFFVVINTQNFYQADDWFKSFLTGTFSSNLRQNLNEEKNRIVSVTVHRSTEWAGFMPFVISKELMSLPSQELSSFQKFKKKAMDYLAD